MQRLENVLKEGTKVRTHAVLGEPPSVSVVNLKQRKPDAVGVIVGVPLGTAGDVYWVQHDGPDSLPPAAYYYTEFEPEPTCEEVTGPAPMSGAEKRSLRQAAKVFSFNDRLIAYGLRASDLRGALPEVVTRDAANAFFQAEAAAQVDHAALERRALHQIQARTGKEPEVHVFDVDKGRVSAPATSTAARMAEHKFPEWLKIEPGFKYLDDDDELVIVLGYGPDGLEVCRRDGRCGWCLQDVGDLTIWPDYWAKCRPA